jgi:hypothetical protein
MRNRPRPLRGCRRFLDVAARRRSLLCCPHDCLLWTYQRHCYLSPQLHRWLLFAKPVVVVQLDYDIIAKMVEART